MSRKVLVMVLLSSLILFGVIGGNVGFFSLSEEQDLDIGLITALSGKYAFIGLAYANGLELAADEINERGGINGKKINLIMEDSQGSPKEGVIGANKLLNVDGVRILISEFTGQSMAIKDIIDDNILYFYVSTDPRIAKHGENIFRDYFDMKNHGHILAEKVNADGCKTVKIISEKTDQTQLFKLEFMTFLNSDIEIIAVEDIDPKSEDIKTDIAKLSINEGDCLVSGLWQQEAYLMKEIKSLGLINKVRTYHLIAPYMPSANSPELKKMYAENNSVSTWYGISESNKNDLQNKFVNKYEERYGISPLTDSSYGYDDMYLFANVLEICDYSDISCIIEELHKVNFHGISGSITFDDFGSSCRDTFLIQMIDGEWTKIE